MKKAKQEEVEIAEWAEARSWLGFEGLGEVFGSYLGDSFAFL